ncbi:MAG: MarR family transcriptional regulator [Pseudomonadales bacterium]
MSELEDGFGFLIHDIARQITTAFDERLKSYNMTRSNWRAILYIWRTPGITQTELSDILDLSRMGVTGLIDRMEDKGLVCRKDDARDRRIKRIYLTESTAELMPLINKLGQELVDDLFQDFSDSDRKRTFRLLLRVKDNGFSLLYEDTGKEAKNRG